MRFSVVPAAYVLLRRDGRVLLHLRRNTGYRDGHWATAAAGHVEEGEPVTAAACREAAEELGVVIEPVALVPLTTMHRTHRNRRPIDERVDFFFMASKWSGEPRLMEPEKAAGLDWYPLDKLPDPLVPHEARVLGAVADGDALPAVIAQGFA